MVPLLHYQQQHSTNCCTEENPKLSFVVTFPNGRASRNLFLLKNKALCEKKKGVLLHFGLRPLLATLVTTELEISAPWQSLKGQARASLWPGDFSDGAPGRLLKARTQIEVRHMTKHFLLPCYSLHGTPKFSFATTEEAGNATRAHPESSRMLSGLE